MIDLFRKAPVLMTIAVLLAGALGAAVAYWQNKPELDAANKRLQALRDEVERVKPKEGAS